MVLYTFIRKIQRLLALCLGLFALTYCSGMTGGGAEGGPVGNSPIGGSVAAANGSSSSVLSAPADDDLMGNTFCNLPILAYGDGFLQSFKDKDWASWHIETGSTFSGKFMLIGTAGYGYKDIQIRILYSNASGTERRYRDIKFPEVPPEGSVFEVTIDKVGFGDFVTFLIMPRKRVYGPSGRSDDFTCAPADLPNFSEAWTNAGPDVEKDLGLLAKFKIFTTLTHVETVDHPFTAPDVLELDPSKTP